MSGTCWYVAYTCLDVHFLCFDKGVPGSACYLSVVCLTYNQDISSTLYRQTSPCIAKHPPVSPNVPLYCQTSPCIAKRPPVSPNVPLYRQTSPHPGELISCNFELTRSLLAYVELTPYLHRTYTILTPYLHHTYTHL